MSARPPAIAVLLPSLVCNTSVDWVYLIMEYLHLVGFKKRHKKTSVVYMEVLVINVFEKRLPGNHACQESIWKNTSYTGIIGTQNVMIHLMCNKCCTVNKVLKEEL